MLTAESDSSASYFFRSSGLHAIAGPLPGIPGWKGGPASEAVVRADADIGAKGYLSFWVQIPETIMAKPGLEQRILTIAEGPISVRLLSRDAFAGFFFTWPGENVESFRTLVPGFPGPGWYHFVLQWDAAEGELNGFLNGTPLRMPDARIDPWQPVKVDEITFKTENVAIAAPVLSGERVDRTRLKEQVSQLYYGNMDLLLGARPLGELDAEPYKDQLIYENTFATKENIVSWVLEGPGKLSFEDGWMTMASELPDGPEGHVVFWYNEDLPARFIAEWEFQPMEEHGLCIVFFAAKGQDGQSIFDPQLQVRNGLFSRYHSGDINCYHISYFTNTPNEPGRITSNLRKNSGFFLVSSGPEGVPSGSLQPHKVTLFKDGEHIRMAIDGRVIIDWRDDGSSYGPIWQEGKIGLRQMQWTLGRYRNFKVFSVKQGGNGSDR